MLREIIEQNYNHPSVIIWSLGNEIYWLPDFEGGNDIDKLKDYLTELNNYAHELDPYRKTAIRKFYEGSDIVDVFPLPFGLDGILEVIKVTKKQLTSTKKNTNIFYILSMEVQAMLVGIQKTL